MESYELSGVAKQNTRGSDMVSISVCEACRLELTRMTLGIAFARLLSFDKS